LDKRVRALVEQDPIHTAIEGVERIHRYRAQAGAVRERIVSDAGDAVGDHVGSGFAPGHWISVFVLLLNKTPSTLL